MRQTRIRRMVASDIPAGQRLREQAGWNQSDDDWRRLLEWEPNGCWVAEVDGQVVATTTTTTYGWRLAFVGMVLVDEAWRRQGIGRTMLRQAMAYLDDIGVETIGLDATPAGRPLYEQLGYVEQVGLARWRGPIPSMAGGGARPMLERDLGAVARFDAGAFGVERAHVVGALFHGNPAGCFLVERAGEIEGYVLTRPGARAWHLGPLVARDGEVADRLARTALHPLAGGEMVIDVVMANPAAVDLAHRLGLAQVRPFTRMTRGAPPPPVDIALLYTSAGPEIG